MASSQHPIDVVLMYDTIEDRAFWVTPSHSWILLNVYPHLERIEPDEECYEWVVKMAPPKPVVYPKERVPRE